MSVTPRLGQLEEAMRFTKKLSPQSDYADAYYNMGNALKEQVIRRSDEAYNEAISIKSDYAEAYNNMGDLLQAQGKLDEAIEAYKSNLRKA